MSTTPGKLRILPIGGCGEIGKNLTIIEYDDEMIIIDSGIMFPMNDMLGIDFIIPDLKYVVDNREKVQAILLTHGHEDHIGALTHVIEQVNVPVYGTPLTVGFVENKLKEAKLRDKATVREFQAGDAFNIGRHFMVEPFHVTHSIPDCVGFGITTPVGLIVHTGDYKIDYTPADGWPPDFGKVSEFSSRGVLALLADSTNANTEGWTPSEKVVDQAFDDLFASAEGRIIVVTFASLISRIQQVADMAQKYGRKLAITGRSMRDNYKTATDLGYLDISEDLLIDIDQANKLPADQVAIMATGSQGEPTSVLGRLAFGRHRTLGIRQGDTVVLSAHTIPGNEEGIHRIVNRLLQQGAHVLYEENARVHVSGHAAREEMKLMINLVRPRYFIPVHGELRHLVAHGAMAASLGIPRERIAVIENGTPVELDAESLTVLDRLPGGYVFVDGSGVGDIGWSVMRDREKLSDNGFFVAVVGVDADGALRGRPQMITRGFANLKGMPGLLDGAEEIIVQAVESYSNQRQTLPSRVEEALSRYLYAETGRRPMVYAVVG